LKFVKNQESPVVIMEATGIYHIKLCQEFENQGVKYVVLNPFRAKQLIRGLFGYVRQTDKVDSQLLCEIGYQIKNLEYSTVADTKILELRNLRNLYRVTLLEERAWGQRARSQGKIDLLSCESAKNVMSSWINLLLQRKNDLMSEAKKLILSSEKWSRYWELLQTIPGVGEYLSLEFLCLDVDRFQSFSSLSRFVGVTPADKDSGSSVVSTGSTWSTSDKEFRNILYMMANLPKCGNFRLIKLEIRLEAANKHPKVIGLAKSRLLLQQMFSVVRKDEPYKDSDGKLSDIKLKKSVSVQSLTKTKLKKYGFEQGK